MPMTTPVLAFFTRAADQGGALGGSDAGMRAPAGGGAAMGQALDAPPASPPHAAAWAPGDFAWDPQAMVRCALSHRPVAAAWRGASGSLCAL